MFYEQGCMRKNRGEALALTPPGPVKADSRRAAG